MIYRTDIDGLRAVAVSLVVVFHINEALIPGGFIGVDMFFVISGYLITGIILRDIDAGEFSFKEFYRRRAKRIFPAVFVVTLATLLVGAWVLLPNDMVALSKSALATTLFVANYFFTTELDTGYFAADSRTIPLLHMWSLGVEEQFYLLWPILLLGLAKATKLSLPLLAIVFLASIALGEIAIYQGWFSFAYYMLPTRAFQLVAGAMLVFLERTDRFKLSSGTAFFLGVCGLAALFWSAAYLDGETDYPGLHALPITVGTMLLLASGRSPQPLKSVLSLRPLRWLGFISFSLYLWHWPVLAFLRYLIPEFGRPHQAASLIVMLLLSLLTYWFVEKPFRERPVTFLAAMRRYWIYPALFVGALGLAHIETDGYGIYRFTDLSQRIENQNQPAFRLPFVCQATELTMEDTTNPNCVLGGQGTLNTLLVGDSNAAHFVGAFDEIARQLDFRFRNIAHSACPPLVGDTRPFTSTRRREACVRSRAIIAADPVEYQKIILAAGWDGYFEIGGLAFLEELKATVDAYSSDGARILLIGVVPRQFGFDRRCALKKLKQSWIDCGAATTKAKPPEINTLLAELAAQTPGVWYMDPFPALCDETICPTLFGNDALYFDPRHLSYFGSQHVGKLWLQMEESHSVLSSIFENN